MEKRIYWNDGWKFHESYEKQMRENAYPDDGWERVRLPHTCRETPFIILMRAVIRCSVVTENTSSHRRNGKIRL